MIQYIVSVTNNILIYLMQTYVNQMFSAFNFASNLRIRLVIKEYVLNAISEILKRTFKLLLRFGGRGSIFL